MKKKSLKVIELFAGVGGFRLGLEGYKGKSPISGYEDDIENNVDFKVVYSNQWEPSTKIQHASIVYETQFGKEGHFNSDVSELSTTELKEKCDVLVGGFPCQDYSVANSLRTSRGLLGKKGVLWWQIERILSDLGSKKPKYLILENVDRLIKSPASQRGRDFAVMLASLNDLGYIIEWRIINAAEYGLPQRRRRVFIFGYLENTEVGKARKKSSFIDWVESDGIFGSSFPSKSKGLLEEFELIGGLEEVSKNYGSNSSKSKSIFQNSGISIKREVKTIDVKPSQINFNTTLGDVLQSPEDVGIEFWIGDEDLPKWRVEKGAKRKERTTSNGHVYLFSEGGMNFPDLTELPSRTIITSEGGKSASRTTHVIEQEGRLRRLTPVELERLNMFPDDFTNVPDVNYKKRAFLMGNALVVGVIEKLAKSLGDFESIQ
jgi:DNA (cytosine-5)-methyltransferase 1